MKPSMPWSIGSGAEVKVPILIQQFFRRGANISPDRARSGTTPPWRIRWSGSVARPCRLLEILNGPNGDMRFRGEGLARIGPAARAAVPRSFAIEHPDPKLEPKILVLYAIRALGRIGPEAKAAIPVLNGLLERKIAYAFDDPIRRGDRPGPDRRAPVRKLLDTFLREADSAKRQQLAWLGPKAREAVPSLRAALTDQAAPGPLLRGESPSLISSLPPRNRSRY